MTIWVLPHIAWAVHGTAVSLRDILVTVAKPLSSGILAALASAAITLLLTQSSSSLTRLIVGSAVLLTTYFVILLFPMGQMPFYLDLIQKLRRRSSYEEEMAVSA
jgi:hypothetical protein